MAGCAHVALWNQGPTAGLTQAQQGAATNASGPVRLPPSVHTAKVTWVSDLAYSCPANEFVLERPVLNHRPARVKPGGCNESMVEQFRNRPSPGTPPQAVSLQRAVALSAQPAPKLLAEVKPDAAPPQFSHTSATISGSHKAQALQYVQAFHDLVMHRIHYDVAKEGMPLGLTTVLVAIDEHNGTIRSAQIRHSSGNAAWDMAVVQAIQGLGVAPKDGGRWDATVLVTAAPSHS